jgi:hypothetical protein
VVKVRIDRSDEADEPDRDAAPRRPPNGDGDIDRNAATDGAISGDDPVRQQFPRPDQSVRVEQVLAHRATVDAVYRRYAIDQGCARVEKLERETVTPAMRRIEAEDPDRSLIGLEHRLKGKDRLTEKVAEAMTERARTPDQAFATVKDAIRYTFCYPDDHYTEGVHADCDRLEHADFEPVERRNSWENDEYKGINSRWRVPGTSQLFEVQFHTQASFEAKQETHGAYEKLRDPATSKAEQEALSAYQREVTARIPIPYL